MKYATLIPCLLLSLPSILFAQNLVVNGGFERDKESWHEHGSAKAVGQIDATQSHSGKASFHITNASPMGPHVYYRIFQAIPVQPNTRYVMGVWCKGGSVGLCWIGGDPNWLLRHGLPAGEYDWRWVSTEYTTGPDEKTFNLMILTENETGDLWLDDVYFAPADSSAGDFYPVEVEKGLPPACRFYPALPRDAAATPPMVNVRSKEDPTFGFDAYFTWDAEGLHVNLIALDTTPGAPPNPKMPSDLFGVDSFQVAVDTQPQSPKEGFSSSCYELGFSLGSDGKITQYAWQAGGLDPFHAPTFPAEGKRTPEGYQLHILLTWEKLQVDPANPPEVLGVNVLLNDDQAGKGRRWVEWTYGVGWGVKTPDRFARLVRVLRVGESNPASASYMLFDAKAVFTEKDCISGQFIQYAFESLPAQKAEWFCTGAKNEPVLRWGESELPAVPAGSVRWQPFLLPVSQLKGEGEYHAVVKPSDGGLWCSVPFQRANLIRRLTELKQKNEARMAEIRKQAEEKQLLSNAYVEMGLAVGERFCKRVDTHKDQSLDWSILQMEQISDVLDWLETFVHQAVKNGTAFDSPKITGGPVEIRDGAFYTETQLPGGAPVIRPFYFGGFGHFGTVGGATPELRTMGFSAIQQECGPSSMTKEGHLWDIGQGKVDAVQRAGDVKMKVDFLLSPHYYPEWGVEPGVLTDNPSWNKFNVNHPAARKAIGDWIRVILGKLKDKPALLSTCLMNEPSYSVSGLDEQSKPLWAEFLRKKHETIQMLNTLYGTKYESFEEVPVPPPAFPTEVAPRRAFYDWGLFNMDNFAEWHRFEHDGVKSVAPNVYTHSKIIIDRQLGQGSCFGLGVDPERICNVTDLAGCDAWALWPGGEYGYGWWQVLFYDLLHSFRNQPVVNTEYHIITDGGTTSSGSPPEHVYAAYWHAALHHLGMHTTWVWEEPGQPVLMGNISLRPSMVASAARAMLDINRLGEEITAINQAPPKVALLYSIPSILWQSDYEETLKKTYAALNFLGLPITFVSEKQLTEGKLPPAEWVIVPHATHATQPAVDALAKLAKDGKHIVFAGSQCLAFDEYHRPRAIPEPLNETTRLPLVKGNGEELLAKLQSVFQAGNFSQTNLTNVATGKPAWGVEFRCVPRDGKTLVPMLNLLKSPQTVRLDLPGEARDLLTGQAVDLQNIPLESMKPMLLEIRK